MYFGALTPAKEVQTGPCSTKLTHTSLGSEILLLTVTHNGALWKAVRRGNKEKGGELLRRETKRKVGRNGKGRVIGR